MPTVATAAEPRGGETSWGGPVGQWEAWHLIGCVGLTGESKFEEIRRSNQAAAERLAEAHVSSSSEEEEEDGRAGHQDGKTGQILESAFTSYTSQTGDASPPHLGPASAPQVKGHRVCCLQGGTSAVWSGPASS